MALQRGPCWEQISHKTNTGCTQKVRLFSFQFSHLQIAQGPLWTDEETVAQTGLWSRQRAEPGLSTSGSCDLPLSTAKPLCLSLHPCGKTRSPLCCQAVVFRLISVRLL